MKGFEQGWRDLHKVWGFVEGGYVGMVDWERVFGTLPEQGETQAKAAPQKNKIKEPERSLDMVKKGCLPKNASSKSSFSCSGPRLNDSVHCP